MLRQMDIIGEWAKATASRKLPVGITTLEHGPDIWAGFFTWDNIPGWRWRMKAFKSAADFDLTKYDLLLPLLDAEAVARMRSGQAKFRIVLTMTEERHAHQ